MNADDALEQAVQAWRAKHHIPDGDPMLAAVELVQIHLRFAPRAVLDEHVRIPNFEQFRKTMEFLDQRSQCFVEQTASVLDATRSLSQRLSQVSISSLIIITVLALIVGFEIGLAIR